jgi:hypothetical protein
MGLDRKLTTGEKNNKFLLGTENKGSTVWLLVAEKDYLEALQKVWYWAEKKLINRRHN